MFDTKGLGVFVGAKRTRGILRCILFLSFSASLVACSEPDERYPWPTGDDEDAPGVAKVAMPDYSVGDWKSPCFDIDNDSRQHIVSLGKTGEFTAVEFRYIGPGCKGAATSKSRTREGQVDSFELLGNRSLKITAHIYAPFRVGDLIKGEAVLNFANIKALFKPINAELFDIADQKQHLTWDEHNSEEWVITRTQ